MIARVATSNQLVPGDQNSEAIQVLRDTIRNTPGYVAGFHLHDPKSNKAMSITVYEDPTAAQAAGKALAERPDDHRVGIDPDQVEFFQAEPF
jgi:hypothetical protein